MATSIGQLVVDFVSNTAKFRTDVAAAASSASQAAGSIKSSFGSIGGSVQGAIGSMLNFRNVIGTVLGTGGLGLLIKNAVQAGDNIAEMAQRVGVSTDAIQELGHAASLSGASIEDLENGLRFLNKNLGEAQAGGKAAAEAFARIGVDPNKFRDAGEAFGAIADGINSMGNEAQKTEARLAILGRGGNQLAILLNEGSVGIAKLREEAEKLEKSKLDQAQKLADDFTRLSNTIRTQLTRALIDLGPVLLDTMSLFAKFSGYVSGLSQVYKDIFASNDTASLTELSNRIVDVTDKIAKLNAVSKEGSSLAADPKRLAELNAELFALREKLRLRQTLEAKPPTTVSMSVTGGGIDKDAVKALEDFRKKLLMLAIPDETARKLVDLRMELQKLQEAHPSVAAGLKTVAAAMGEIISQNAAAEAIKKLEEEAQKLMDIGDAGTVAAIEANIAAYEEEEAAIRRIGEVAHAANKALEDQGTAGLIAAIEANIDAYESELLAVVKINEEKHRATQANENLATSLQQQIDMLGMSGKAAAIYADQLKLGADATEEMRFKTADLSGALFELKKQQEESKKFYADLNNIVVNTALTMSDALIDFAMTGKASFKEMADAIIKDILRIITKLLILKAIEVLTQSFGGGIGGGASSAAVGSGVGGMASGGIVRHRPGGTLRRLGEGGQDEAVIPLPVMNALGGGGGGDMIVNIHPPAGSKVEQRESQGPDGKQILDVFITAVESAIGEGRYDKVMEATYGARRRGVSR